MRSRKVFFCGADYEIFYGRSKRLRSESSRDSFAKRSQYRIFQSSRQRTFDGALRQTIGEAGCRLRRAAYCGKQGLAAYPRNRKRIGTRVLRRGAQVQEAVYAGRFGSCHQVQYNYRH